MAASRRMHNINVANALRDEEKHHIARKVKEKKKKKYRAHSLFYAIAKKICITTNSDFAFVFQSVLFHYLKESISCGTVWVTKLLA